MKSLPYAMPRYCTKFLFTVVRFFLLVVAAGAFILRKECLSVRRNNGTTHFNINSKKSRPVLIFQALLHLVIYYRL
jgi:hypothetical protein